MPTKAEALAELARRGVAVPNTAKLNAPLQRDEIADIEGMQTAIGTNGMLDRTAGQLDSGDLDLGPVRNFVSQARNKLGMSDQSSRNFASFRSNLEKLRNDSLRLNKGVQTEGDAQRAWNELFTNLNDEALVKQRLAEIQDINARAVANRKQTIQARRSAQNVPAADVNALSAGGRGNPVDLSHGESRNALAPGLYYKDPYGNTRRNENGDRGNPKIDPRTGRQIMDTQNALIPKPTAKASGSGWKVISVE
jgi:hypothetical protein